jgi:uncharacterized protein (DUF983 family)
MELQDPVGPAYFMITIVGIMCVIVIIDIIKDEFKKDKNKS